MNPVPAVASAHTFSSRTPSRTMASVVKCAGRVFLSAPNAVGAPSARAMQHTNAARQSGVIRTDCGPRRIVRTVKVTAIIPWLGLDGQLAGGGGHKTLKALNLWRQAPAGPWDKNQSEAGQRFPACPFEYCASLGRRDGKGMALTR